MHKGSKIGKGFGSAGPCERLPGIVILNRTPGEPVSPRIEAFVYGGEAAPQTRTLPYGRWKGVA